MTSSIDSAGRPPGLSRTARPAASSRGGSSFAAPSDCARNTGARTLPPPHPLGTEGALRERLPLVVERGGHRVRVVEVEGELVAYSPVCPHRLGPLEDGPDEGGQVRCPWHGYAFDVRSGRSCDGRGLRLARAPRLARDDHTGELALVWE